MKSLKVMNFLSRFYTTKLPELFLLAFVIISRFFRLDQPKSYIFDEVYHAFTAQEMLKGNPAAWQWWNTPPAGVAYEWTHPPLAKEFMVLGMQIFGNNQFGYRFFSAIFGIGIIIVIYFLAQQIFKNRLIALFAAFVAACDGLLLVMSRIAMNDSYFVCFALLALLAFLKNRKLAAGICIGLALASKWTMLYGIGILGALLLGNLAILMQQKKASYVKIMIELGYGMLYLIILPICVYLLSYISFFLGPNQLSQSNGGGTLGTKFEQNTIPAQAIGTTWETFIKLQEQMWWYHTGLKAHHDYQSTPFQWILDLRPVWFYVDYKETTIANIYNLGNPLVMWFGLVAVLFSLWDAFRKRSYSLMIIVAGYFGYFLPWVFSPRIMFFYHYMPAVPFLTLAAGYTLHEFLEDKAGKISTTVIMTLMAVLFIYFLPLWTGIHVPKWFNDGYYWFSTWR